MELRHFTNEDWDCFSGCTSSNPLIGYDKSMTLVVDATFVEVYESDRLLETFQFPDIGCAMAFALDVHGSEPPHILDLKADRCGRRMA